MAGMTHEASINTWTIPMSSSQSQVQFARRSRGHIPVIAKGNKFRVIEVGIDECSLCALVQDGAVDRAQALQI